MQIEYLYQLVSYANNILNSLSSNQTMESDWDSLKIKLFEKVNFVGNQQTAKTHVAKLTLCISKAHKEIF